MFVAIHKVKELYPKVKLIESEGTTKLYENLLDHKCGLAAETANRFEAIKLNATLNPDYLLEWVGRGLDISSDGHAHIVDAGIHCTSLIAHVFEYYLKNMERDGTIKVQDIDRCLVAEAREKLPIRGDRSLVFYY